MGNKTLLQAQGLAPADKTLYLDLGNGVYALLSASVLSVGTAEVDDANPLPVILPTDPLPVEIITPVQLAAVKILSLAEAQALNMLGICRWINDKVPGATEVVLTDAAAGDQPGIYYNLQEGEIVVITQMCIELTTPSDDVVYELGYTDAVAGGGTFQPITPKRVYSTGANNQGFEGIEFTIIPPEPVRYTDGARSITFRVDCNDAGTTITPAWHGYILE